MDHDTQLGDQVKSTSFYVRNSPTVITISIPTFLQVSYSSEPKDNLIFLSSDSKVLFCSYILIVPFIQFPVLVFTSKTLSSFQHSSLLLSIQKKSLLTQILKITLLSVLNATQVSIKHIASGLYYGNYKHSRGKNYVLILKFPVNAQIPASVNTHLINLIQLEFLE
jgi:hypothetical protein